jgi:uncharacterized protein (TIRG00374 family)
MKSTFINALKYLAMLGLGGFLFWFVIKDLDFNLFFNELKNANYNWIILSVLISFVAYWSRAVRWNLLLKPLQITPPNSHTFLALMGGYFANIFLPRAGEVVRCLLLKKTDEAPFNATFGSVVAERVIDFLCLLLVIAFATIIEFARIQNFFVEFFYKKFSSSQISSGTMLIIAIIVFGFLVFVYFLWTKRNVLLQNKLITKLVDFALGIWQGVISVKNLENKKAFVLHTILIWVSYFLMTYVVCFALPATSHLSPSTGLVILCVGGLGMSAPVQGGIGAFHYLVASALVIYGVSNEQGVIYALILHSTQTITVIIVGGIASLIALFISKKEKQSHDRI